MVNFKSMKIEMKQEDRKQKYCNCWYVYVCTRTSKL